MKGLSLIVSRALLPLWILYFSPRIFAINPPSPETAIVAADEADPSSKEVQEPESKQTAEEKKARDLRKPFLLLPWENADYDLNSPDIWSDARPDSHAPFGVMGDHVHRHGEVMLGYHFMYTLMGQYFHGEEQVPLNPTLINNILKAITGNPQTHGHVFSDHMNMDMHMFELMYAPTDNLTLMAMVPYMDMDHFMLHSHEGMLMTHTHHAEGVGDVSFTAIWKMLDWDRQRVQLNLGFSVPTGSITETFPEPIHEHEVPLRMFLMQLGSGTVDFLPGLTYLGQRGNLSWGMQHLGVIHTGTNDEGYTFGDRYLGTGWVAYQVVPNWVSASVRVQGLAWDRVEGQDRLNALFFNVHPTFKDPDFQPEFQGGERVDVSVGLNLLIPEGILKENRFAAEAGLPIYQRLNGVQLGTNWWVTGGWQIKF
ncbi:transporter family protein [Candidatus Methylacidithermus pantelleriae]|uniref:Transporter n=1 Tax=Candidatus Methylacidithermus pantelleriae TaxID=2744239 RepID=A0A8J2BRB2_9BACT|nr:transporter [Candidatus Methylacidithermus pantelleriae]CAF0700948.1 conserved hypothetical protein [Candidatus Methylacidithermus pantelleriae]